MAKSRAARRLTKTQRKVAGKQAAKNPHWLNVAAASFPTKPPRIRGTFGAASPVRHLVKDGVSIDKDTP